MTRLVPLLALLLTVLLATPAVSRSAADAYGDALDMMSGSRAVTTAAADEGDEMEMFMAYVEQELNRAKAELKQLGIAYRAVMRELQGDAHECERALLTATYVGERTRLRARLREYRHIRGDRRGFLTKAWHSVGPGGRRVLRALGDGALDIVASGGTLGGGVARRLLMRTAGNELKGAALRGLARSVNGRTAAAVAAAESACRDGDIDDGGLDEGVPAIPPGTYVGEFPLDLSADDFVTVTVVEANSAEFRVSDSGAIAGELGYRMTGVLDGCPGYILESNIVVDDGQEVGSELPQAISVMYDALMVVPISDFASSEDSVGFVCGTDVEPFIDESGSAEAVIDVNDDDVLAITLGEDVVELHWVP